MANMSLGAYTFNENPSDIDDIIAARRKVSYANTIDGVDVFSWGVTIVGKPIELSWEYMTTNMYDELLSLLEADAGVVFDPQDGSGNTFNVEILTLNGTYHMQLTSASNHYRKNVKLVILIISMV